MIALKIEDIRQFTSKLFVGETFDNFLVKEATIVTFNSFMINGHIRKGYYSEQEQEDRGIEDLSSWGVLRPICFSLIKGKRLPESFQIVLQLSKGDLARLFQNKAADAAQVNGLYLNIRYEDHLLHCITGSSLQFFTMDKTLDQEWDDAVKAFLKKHGVAYTVE